ncbi:hypothetical protein COO60DRAFT_1638283 [Scenedesmus sp. NREL 46B-D3]|nr:hypothetical protein COO60DRAFT_1638283 [Scenedesmus sp. NREL 46B-D3]
MGTVFGAAAVVLDHARFIISGNSSVSNNTAYHSGGAIHGSGRSSVVIQGGSLLSFNSASQYGGALQADEMCRIVVRDALLLNNTSVYGGATAIKNSARLQVEAGAVYKDNYGEYGGCSSAVMIAGQGAAFTGNSGVYGGVVAAQNLCNITLISAVLVANKGTYGGCLAVQDNAAIFAGNGTVFRDNVASYGGGIAIQNSGWVVVSHAEFTNCSGMYGGAIVLQNTGTLEMKDASLIYRCKGQFGGAISANEESRITLGSCTIRECTGTLGGAVNIDHVAQLMMNGTFVTNNTATAGGGLIAKQQSRITLVSSNLTHNYAKSDGGAIYLQDNSTLEFGNAASPTSNTSVAMAGHRTAATTSASSSRVIIASNHAKARGGGVAISGHSSFDVEAVLQATHNNTAEFDAEASVPLQHISVVGPSYISGLASRFNRTSGTLSITVNLTGIGGLPCGGRPVQVTLQPSPAVQVLGSAKSNAQGLALLSEVKLRATPGLYTLAVASTTDKELPPALVHVEVRACEVGEVTNELGDACEPCSPGSYSLDPTNFTCDACPLHANCPGGPALLGKAQAGLQLRQLLRSKACGAFYDKKLLQTKGSSVALYVTAAVAMLLFVRLLTHITIVDNENCAAAAAAAAATAQAALLPAPGPAAVLPLPTAPAAAGPSKDASPLSFVPRSVPLQLSSSSGSGPAPELDTSSDASPFTNQDHLSPQGLAHTAAAGHRDRFCARTHGPSNASMYFSSRSLPVCEEPALGFGKHLSSSPAAAKGTCLAAPTEADLPWQSSVEWPVESVNSMGSTVGGLAGAPAVPGAACNAGAGSHHTPTASGAVPGAAGGGGCRASDLLKVLVLYLQYMLLVGSLRVPWPPTLLLPIKALTWFLAASTSQTLALECVMDAAQLPAGLPMAMLRVLFYTLMPLATFMLLWLVEVLLASGEPPLEEDL